MILMIALFRKAAGLDSVPGGSSVARVSAGYVWLQIQLVRLQFPCNDAKLFRGWKSLYMYMLQWTRRSRLATVANSFFCVQSQERGRISFYLNSLLFRCFVVVLESLSWYFMTCRLYRSPAANNRLLRQCLLLQIKSEWISMWRREDISSLRTHAFVPCDSRCVTSHHVESWPTCPCKNLHAT